MYEKSFNMKSEPGIKNTQV